MPTVANDLIAVIVPVYNVAPYLERCVTSIREQTYTNLEIILVDDGSTDESGALCDAYARADARIKVIHQANGGLSAARNTGLAHATAPYVTFVDSDDYVDKDYVRVLYKTLKDAGVPMVVCGINIVELDGKITTTAGGEEFVATTREALLILLRGDGIIKIMTFGKLFRRDLFDQVKFPIGHLHEDMATTYRLIAQCDRVAVKAVPLYYYCLRTDSLTAGNTRYLAHVDQHDYYDATVAYVRAQYPADRDEIDRCTMSFKLWAYQCLLVMKDIEPALKQRLWQYLKQNRSAFLKRKILSPREEQLLRRTYIGRWGFTLYCRLREVYRRWRDRQRSKH